MGSVSSMRRNLILDVEYTSSPSQVSIEFIKAGHLRACVCPWEPLSEIIRRVEVFQWDRQINIFSAAKKPRSTSFAAIRVIYSSFDGNRIKKESADEPIGKLGNMSPKPTFNLTVSLTVGSGCCCAGYSSSYASAYRPVKARPTSEAAVSEATKVEYIGILSPAQQQYQEQQPLMQSGPVDSLEKLADLFQQGLLTADEFNAAKTNLLNAQQQQSYAAEVHVVQGEAVQGVPISNGNPYVGRPAGWGLASLLS